MRFLKKLPMAFGLCFLFLGSLLLFADIIHIRLYGIDIFNGAQYVTDDGQIADAPEESGEIPFFVYIPVYVYAVICWVIAAVAFAFLPLAGKKVCRNESVI